MAGIGSVWLTRGRNKGQTIGTIYVDFYGDGYYLFNRRYPGRSRSYQFLPELALNDCNRPGPGLDY